METPAPEWVRGRLLGRGSFAAVSLAADVPAGRLFVVKSVELSPLHAPAAAVLDGEIRLLKTLSSPYVVSYIADDVTAEAAPASGEVRRYRNLHMEYVPGGTAAEAGAMEERRVRAVARRLALAAEYIHSRGVVHGDVKGRNVLLGLPVAGGGEAKLSDFGSATVVSGDRREVRKIMGTPLWMAPEVARGESPSPAADIWSLGCTVIEMFTGRAPRRGSVAGSATAAEAIYKIGVAGDLPEFPNEFSDLGKDFLEKCLRAESVRRWTAKELLNHPFLADAEQATKWSPRSVLDSINTEFTDCEDQSPSSSYNSNPTQEPNSDQESVIQSARSRIKGLACGRRIQIQWESEGWELVRVPPAQGKGGEEVQGTRGEYSESSSSCREENGDSCGLDQDRMAYNGHKINIWCSCRVGLGCHVELHMEQHCGSKKGLELTVGSDTYSSLLLLPPPRGRCVFMAKDYCQLRFNDNEKIYN